MAGMVTITQSEHPAVTWQSEVTAGGKPTLRIGVGLSGLHLTVEEYEEIKVRADALIAEHLDPPKDPIGEAMTEEGKVAWQELGGGQP